MVYSYYRLKCLKGDVHMAKFKLFKKKDSSDNLLNNDKVRELNKEVNKDFPDLSDINDKILSNMNDFYKSRHKDLK